MTTNEEKKTEEVAKKAEHPHETKAEEAAKLDAARLNGTEVEYRLDRQQREFNATLQFDRNQRIEEHDQDRFDTLCDRTPPFARVRQWVENFIQGERAKGNYGITREAVAKYRIGELTLQRSGGATARQTQRAATQRPRQMVRRPGPGSDAAPAGRKREADLSAEEFEQRFGNVPLRG